MIRLTNVSKIYNPGKAYEVEALRNISLHISAGEFVAITGKSGAGKSTLLHILGCIDVPTAGTYELLGENVETLSEGKLAQLRNNTFGFVMQDYALIDGITAYENIILPALLKKKGTVDLDARVDALADKVGISHLLKKNVNHLSGGERQRVAIARALINQPKILIADEPTGNLDSATATMIFERFQRINEDGMTIVLVTHDNDLADRCKRQIVIGDGALK